jgi:O-methyltransferase
VKDDYSASVEAFHTFMERIKSIYRRYVIGNQGMKFPPFEPNLARVIRDSGDPVRYGSCALAIAAVEREGIPGAFAEVGVWRGDTSRLIHLQAPHRTLHLFDTFKGFPICDLGNAKAEDAIRFRDTSLTAVKSRLGNTDNVVFHVGCFPETAKGLEDETFSLVWLDLDIHKPTLAGLDFFYPRTARGGYCFLHDYNSPESDYAIRRAVTSFLKDKPEFLVELPDRWGSVMFRKL